LGLEKLEKREWGEQENVQSWYPPVAWRDEGGWAQPHCAPKKSTARSGSSTLWKGNFPRWFVRQMTKLPALRFMMDI